MKEEWTTLYTDNTWLFVETKPEMMSNTKKTPKYCLSGSKMWFLFI